MTADITTGAPAVLDDKKIFYNRFLLLVAGLGGLLYGVDVGIIAGALPYLQATSHLNAGQLSFEHVCTDMLEAGWPPVLNL